MPFSYYAVRIGRKSGIYPSWPECQTQTSDFKGAVFRGFNDLKHAQYYMETGHVPNEQRFYSVARGITPGIYTSWADASKQVTECRYSKYKRFDTLEDAQAYFTQHSRRKNPKPKLHQNPFQSYDNFTPNPTASFVDEFDRLASSQGWQPGTQAFKEHKVEALSAEIRRCFFTGVYRSVKKEPVATAMSDPVEQRETEGNARNNEPQIKQEPLELALDNEGAVDALDDWSDCKSDISFDISCTQLLSQQMSQEDPIDVPLSDEGWLLGWQDLCSATGKDPRETVVDCIVALKTAPFVNIVDLIDSMRLNKMIPRWDDFNQFQVYTRGDRSKTIPISLAKNDVLLSPFLQNFSKGPQDAPHVKANLNKYWRDTGVSHKSTGVSHKPAGVIGGRVKKQRHKSRRLVPPM